jgi:hypothetical protein
METICKYKIIQKNTAKGNKKKKRRKKMKKMNIY